MFDKLARYYKGRVLIKASGENISQFMNVALKDGVVFYNSRRNKEYFIAEISIKDFGCLRGAARVAGVKITIRAKYGFPFVAIRWLNRKGLLIGLFLIFVVLVVMSQFVLSVSVEGNKRVSDDVILNEAEKFGINRWAFKDNLDLNVIGKELPKNIPDIVWSALEARGTNINIKVVEKTLPEKNVGSGDLVAAKAGLVQEIMVIEGQALIHEGETVKAGQVVIKAGGGLKEYSFGNSSEGKEIVVTNPSAKGFVRGRVWYSAESKVLLEEDITEESGAETIGWGIKIKDRVIMITNELCPYESAINKTNSYNLPSWRNWRFPVEIIKVKYRQTLVHHVKRTIDEAQRLAESLAREEMEALIPPDVKVLKDKIRIIESGKGVEHVRVEAETYEELAVYVQ